MYEGHNLDTGKVLNMVNGNGVSKGKRRVLEDRSINKAWMNADDMRIVLANNSDFQEEKTVVET